MLLLLLMLVAADSWHWQSIDDSVVCPMPPSSCSADYRQLLMDYDLCITGQVD